MVWLSYLVEFALCLGAYFLMKRQGVFRNMSKGKELLLFAAVAAVILVIVELLWPVPRP